MPDLTHIPPPGFLEIRATHSRSITCKIFKHGTKVAKEVVGASLRNGTTRAILSMHDVNFQTRKEI
jgi:hypothetical protein